MKKTSQKNLKNLIDEKEKSKNSQQEKKATNETKINNNSSTAC